MIWARGDVLKFLKNEASFMFLFGAEIGGCLVSLICCLLDFNTGWTKFSFGD